MKKENSTDSPDGVSYEGFCIDLLNALQGKLKFEYELKLRDEFGERQVDGSWSGMIGELAKKVNPAIGRMEQCIFTLLIQAIKLLISAITLLLSVFMAGISHYVVGVCQYHFTALTASALLKNYRSFIYIDGKILNTVVFDRLNHYNPTIVSLRILVHLSSISKLLKKGIVTPRLRPIRKYIPSKPS